MIYQNDFGGVYSAAWDNNQESYCIWNFQVRAYVPHSYDGHYIQEIFFFTTIFSKGMFYAIDGISKEVVHRWCWVRCWNTCSLYFDFWSEEKEITYTNFNWFSKHLRSPKMPFCFVCSENFIIDKLESHMGYSTNSWLVL